MILVQTHMNYKHQWNTWDDQTLHALNLNTKDISQNLLNSIKTYQSPDKSHSFDWLSATASGIS